MPSKPMGRAQPGSLGGDLESAFDALDQVERPEHEIEDAIRTLRRARDILRDPVLMKAIQGFAPSNEDATDAG